jgi:hypothetical protein
MTCDSLSNNVNEFYCEPFREREREREREGYGFFLKKWLGKKTKGYKYIA